jgi:hypothetical protein
MAESISVFDICRKTLGPATRVKGPQIAARPDGQDPTGAPYAIAQMTPTVEIAAGTESIDGVAFVFEAHSGGEAADELVIRLPEHGVLIAQDLLYNRLHLFLGDHDIAGWQREIADCLAAAGELLGEDGEAYKKAIVDRYPGYGAARS